MTRWLRAVPVLSAMMLAACELQEIMVAPASDVIIAEVVLHAGSTLQTAYLHRSVQGSGSGRVNNARVTITDEEQGQSFELSVADDDVCLEPAPPPLQPDVGTCYAATVPSQAVRPGVAYSLHIAIPDRAALRATTRVPSDFQFVAPAIGECRLPPFTTAPVTWTRSEGAWVYVLQARFHGLADALRDQGVTVPPGVPDPLNLLAVAIGAADTTAAFPGTFGVFDRGDEELHPVLVAIRDGLPPGVDTELVVAAADRNYVNWVRGGSFNPSGLVRVPSISGGEPGGGTGVFGSLVSRRTRLRTGGDDLPCS